jgi:hypothetical protein
MRWVLDTHTKGTGATMVPLDSVLTKPGSKAVPGFRLPDRKRPEPEPGTRAPHVFKIVELTTRKVLAEGVDARAAVRALGDVRSIVDVSISVWDPEAERWRMLSFAERRTLWEYRDRVKP